MDTDRCHTGRGLTSDRSRKPQTERQLMTTSLVTGGAGFLGSHLCEELLVRGHRVICVDNLETGSGENIEHMRSDPFSFLHVDIIEPFFVKDPVDFVYHFA